MKDGSVRCWGRNGLGQLGDGTKRRVVGAAPIRITPVEQVALSVRSCAVLRDRTACCDGDAGPHVRAPIAVKELNDVIGIALGSGHSCALGKDGRVRCWGSNKEGKLGDGTQERSATQVPVSDLDGVTQIAAGADHSCARTKEGGVAC